MSKYNFELKIQENDPLSKLLYHIKKDSVVLEFGCANGRMTKYMSQHLNCDVYIVEYNPEDYAEAINFAKDGICGDLTLGTWEKKFHGIKFDYIIFADVLEHLVDPKRALKRTFNFLKETGSVLISVPNVCHNDIIWNMIHGYFKYTSIGLLDNTHVHFFSENTLNEFVQDTGYKIVYKDYTRMGTGSTEQFDDSPMHYREFITNTLLNRKNGTVYQFILKLQKEFIETKEYVAPPIYAEYAGKLYYNTGDGYSEQFFDEIIGEFDDSGEIVYRISRKKLSTIVSMRFDPCEQQKSIVTKIIDLDTGKTIQPKSNASIVCEEGLYFDTIDPQIEFKNDSQQLNVEIRLLLPGISYMERIEKIFTSIERKTEKKLQIKTEELNYSKEENEKQKQIIQELDLKLKQLNKELTEIKNSKTWLARQKMLKLFGKTC